MVLFKREHMVHIQSHVREDSARHTVGNNVLWGKEKQEERQWKLERQKEEKKEESWKDMKDKLG